jgi:RIO kinase 2
MYMSRLAALKEYTFMQALRANGFAVPEPIAQSRHTIVMSLVDAFPLRQISMVPDPAGLYDELIEMILQLARYGLIHGDFNEFNILIKEETVTAITTTPPASASASTFSNNAQLVEPISSTEPLPSTEQPCAQPPDPHNTTTTTITPILIDFPQMVSIDHANAAMYFDRDVQCIKRFFARRFHFTSDAPGPFFADARKLVGRDGATRLDVAAEASGFSKKMAKELEAYMREVGVDGDGVGGGVMGDEDEDGDEGDPDADADDEDTDEDGMEGESMEVKSKEVEKRLTNGVEEEIRGHSVVEISSQPQPEDQYSTTTESIAAEADGRHVSSGQSARLFENLQINNHT